MNTKNPSAKPKQQMPPKPKPERWRVSEILTKQHMRYLDGGEWKMLSAYLDHADWPGGDNSFPGDRLLAEYIGLVGANRLREVKRLRANLKLLGYLAPMDVPMGRGDVQYYQINLPDPAAVQAKVLELRRLRKQQRDQQKQKRHQGGSGDKSEQLTPGSDQSHFYPHSTKPYTKLLRTNGRVPGGTPRFFFLC